MSALSHPGSEQRAWQTQSTRVTLANLTKTSNLYEGVMLDWKLYHALSIVSTIGIGPEMAIRFYKQAAKGLLV